MGDVLHLVKPDGDVIREFADEVDSLKAEGRDVRGTIMICMVDDGIMARAHVDVRLTAVLGALILAGQILQEDFNRLAEEASDEA